MSSQTLAPEDRPRRSDGERTHGAILEAAMRLASIEGLGGLTIGRLAAELGVSKSGVYAHFRSKERLQRETINAARAVFETEVIAPGLQAREGLPQLEGLCEAFLSYVERGVFPGGCFFGQILAELDAQRGPLHGEVAETQRGWLALLQELGDAACERGELAPDTDTRQLAFELTAVLELANYLSTLYEDADYIAAGRAGVTNLIARNG